MVERAEIPRCRMSAAANSSLGGIMPKTSLVETDLAGRLRLATDESAIVKYLLVGASLTFLILVLFVPLAAIFSEALSKGFAVYAASFTDPQALAAVRLTMLVACVC